MIWSVNRGYESFDSDGDTDSTTPFTTTTGFSWSTSNVDDRVGLYNQGATCYLNSLIQALFMTAEFREAVFNWVYDKEKDGESSACMPLQLQLLFCEMQQRKVRAASTRALTKSFGWTGTEAFTQVTNLPVLYESAPCLRSLTARCSRALPCSL